MKLSLGVFTIGSLYWDPGSVRTSWRDSRLKCDEAVAVHAPIRYGRRSQTRGNSYTMVLSQALSESPNRVGTAIFLPCKRSFDSIDQVISEAELLWAAERNQPESNGDLSARWGSVALMINPEKEEGLGSLRSAWANRVREESNYGELNHARNEKPAVTEEGGLNLSWPRTTDESELDFDALLVTATNPEIISGNYANPETIAQAWKEGNGAEYVDYFRNNKKHGIQTFQDGKIEKFLSVKENKKVG